jgi:nitrate reductase gamma subunit
MNNAVKILYPVAAVTILVLLPLLTLPVPSAEFIFAVVIPCLALVAFFTGFIYRIVRWAQSPVPFNITTVAGQEKSLPWIKDDKIESPGNNWAVTWRMFLEIFFFRSLFRNSRADMVAGQRLVYGGSRWLWLGGLAFHWSLLVIIFRHLRFFTEPVFPPVTWLTSLDSLFQFSLSTLFLSDFIILTALTYLFLRRVVSPQIKYISLASDYLALLLILGVIISGILMRWIFKVDADAVKRLAISMITFSPAVSPNIGLAFYIHLMLVCTLIAYFPFSKMMHAPGILFSPTRNMKNNSRSVRHINPWNRPVRVHTYEEYEDEFRKPMIAAGLPVEKKA